jgi:hypothetical protein
VTGNDGDTFADLGHWDGQRDRDILRDGNIVPCQANMKDVDGEQNNDCKNAETYNYKKALNTINSGAAHTLFRESSYRN